MLQWWQQGRLDVKGLAFSSSSSSFFQEEGEEETTLSRADLDKDTKAAAAVVLKAFEYKGEKFFRRSLYTMKDSSYILNVYLASLSLSKRPTIA